MISRAEILMNRDVANPLSPQLEQNLDRLLKALNEIRAAYGKPLSVTSGYRPGKYNIKAGGALTSAHLFCMACDFADTDRSFTNWCLANLDLLEKAGLWMEDPATARTWVHLDIRPRKQRVFLP